MQVYANVSAAPWEFDPAGPTGLGKYLLIHVGDPDLVEALKQLVGDGTLLSEDGCTYLQLTHSQITDAASRAARNSESILAEAAAFEQTCDEEAADDTRVAELEAEKDELAKKLAKQEVLVRTLRTQLQQAEEQEDTPAPAPEPEATTEPQGGQVLPPTPESLLKRGVSPRKIEPGTRETGHKYWQKGTPVQVTDQSVGYRNQQGKIVRPIKIGDRPAYAVQLASAGEVTLLQSQIRPLV